MKRYLWLIIALISSSVFAQVGKIKFEKTEHEFGKINEEAGIATYVFSFTNEGNGPLIVTNAQASCGCTTPDWTKEPILPKGKGYIKVAYNPAGRPGPFTKGVSVSTNGEPETVQLTIKGEVMPIGSEKAPESREYVQYFPYNKKVITLVDKKFQDYIKSLLPNYQKFGKLTFNIESSSSRVPTRKFSNNRELTELRASEARKRLLIVLKENGVDVSKVNFGTDKNVVQGPEYKKDSKEKMSEYEKFQYVKVIGS
jgi:hypothetical protein